MNLWLCWGSTAHGVKFMKMHQFAFVQKCPALTSTALPPPTPLNVQLTLSGEKVNMSMPPYPISDVGLLTLIWWSGSYQRNVPYDIFATLCRAVNWKYEKYLCTIGRVRRVSFFLLDSTGVLKKLCCGGYKKIILILKISTSIHNEAEVPVLPLASRSLAKSSFQSIKRMINRIKLINKRFIFID